MHLCHWIQQDCHSARQEPRCQPNGRTSSAGIVPGRPKDGRQGRSSARTKGHSRRCSLSRQEAHRRRRRRGTA